MATTRLKLEAAAAGDAISRIRFAPHSNNLLFSSWDTVLRLYDVDSSVLRFEAPTKAALINCCFQDESTALSVGSDCCIRRYDLCSGVQHIVGRHNDLPNCIEYCNEIGQAITAGLDKTVRFWDMRMANDCTEHTITVDKEVESISICGFYLLVATGMTINLYDLRNLKESHQIISSADHQIKCIGSFPNCQGYVTGSVDGCVALGYFDSFAQNEMGYIFRCCRKGADGKHYHATVNDFAFHPSYGTFVTGDNEGSAIIWDGQSRKRLLELPLYPNSVASLSFSCTGEILAVASSYTYQEANEVVTVEYNRSFSPYYPADEGFDTCCDQPSIDIDYFME